MEHVIHRVVGFEIVEPYTLDLRFADGSERRIDFRPVLEGELFGPLQDSELFNAVSLDTVAGTIVWPNGADFDPTSLHDWPTVSEAFVAMANRWAHQRGGAVRNAG
jgi:glycine/D-amino acid oxidase-like deaminating enzyme